MVEEGEPSHKELPTFTKEDRLSGTSQCKCGADEPPVDVVQELQKQYRSL